MKFQTLVILMLALTPLWSQTDIGLVAYYSFDNCDATDDTGNGADGVISGGPGCDCGVINNALVFDGTSDFIQFLGNFDILFADNFTVSFYIRPEGFTGIVDILSKRATCTPDSAITIRWEPGSGSVRAEIAEGISASNQNRLLLDQTRCWHHVAWVRSGGNTLIYSNGILVETLAFPRMLNANNNGIFSIANSPCLANGELRYAGAMDELRLYNRALSSAEIFDLFRPIDEIANRDTVIFLGSSIQTSVPNTCALAFNWSPSNGVTLPGDQQPQLAPIVSTTYRMTLDYGSCIARDTLRVVVVDASELDCESIFLPNAFTPNGDDLNDRFGLSNGFFIGDFEKLEVFDRWGARLFEGLAFDEKWDGTHRGEDVMPGMYIYKLHYVCSGDARVRTGSFSLIK